MLSQLVLRPRFEIIWLSRGWAAVRNNGFDTYNGTVTYLRSLPGSDSTLYETVEIGHFPSGDTFVVYVTNVEDGTLIIKWDGEP